MNATKPQLLGAIIVSAAVFLACDGGGSTSAAASADVRITPREAAVWPLQSVGFTAVVTGSTPGVTWRVEEGPAGGIVTPAGLYTAPDSPGTYHVTVTSDAGPSDTATVYVTRVNNCATEPLRSTGTVYFFCNCDTTPDTVTGTAADPSCVAGNDANAGTDPSAPKRSLAEANRIFRSMRGGDTVALCRGGAWAGTIGDNLSNPNCSAGATCDLRDYVPSWGSSSTARPKIHSPGSTILGLYGPSTGTSTTRGYRFWNMHLVRTDPADNSDLFSMFDQVSDVDICGNRFRGTNDTRNSGINLNNSSRLTTGIVIRHNEFVDNGQAFYGGAQGLVIDSNHFEGTWYGGVQHHAIYLARGYDIPSSIDPTGYENERITNNTFFAKSTAARPCDATVVTHHGVHTNLLWENNYIEVADDPSVTGNCYAFDLSESTTGHYGFFTNFRMLRNRIVAPSRTGINVSNCVDCTIADNLVVKRTGGTGISLPYKAGATPPPGGTYGGTNPQNQGGIVQNNTVVYLEGGGTGVSISSNSTLGSDFVVENNAVWSTGGTCFSIGRPTTRNGNNYCRTSGDALSAVFVDAANGDFRPANPGPLIGAANQTFHSLIALGTVQWDPTDPGVPRTPPADIGAFAQ